jgi:hypothetical protein
VRVLLSLDESSYSGGTMSGDHPIAWCQNYRGGRAWYTGLGHTEESYADPNFTTMLLGGIKIAAGSVAANCGLGTPPTATPTPTQTPVPAGASLRSYANGKYVSADNSGNSPLIAKATTVGVWERFDVIDRGSGNIALRARVNAKYVCADNAGAASLIANRTAIGAWETFQLIRNSDGSVSLRAQANGRYVTAENAGAQPLIANRTAIGAWEKFDLVGV